MQTTNIMEGLSVLGRASAEGGVLVLVILLVQGVLRERLTAKWRCALWLLVALRLCLPVSFASAVSVYNLWPHHLGGVSAAGTEAAAVNLATFIPESQSRSPVLVSATVHPAGLTPEPVVSGGDPVPAPGLAAAGVPAKAAWHWSWPMALLAVWLAGVAVLGARMFFISVRLARRFASLPPVREERVWQCLAECRERMGVRTPLRMVECPDIGSPALHGLWRPQLLLPPGLAARFSAQELRFIFLHELAHWKRRDLWVNWLLAGLQIFHWFNPLVWLGFARWRADRELACDALALEAAGAEHNQEYGRTILRLLENFTERTALPGVVGILEDRRQLRRRIEMIARFRPASRWSALAAVLVGLLAAGCLTDAKPGATAGKPAGARTVKENPVSAVPVTTSPAAASPVSVYPFITNQGGGKKLPFALDLNTYYTYRYVTATTTNSTFKDIAGLQTIDGLPFDIEGKIVLSGRANVEWSQNDPDAYPEQIAGIKIGRKFEELHLIQTAEWHEYHGCVIGEVRLNYADGTSHTFAIGYDVHTMANRLLSEEKEVLTDPGSKLIWRGHGPYKGDARLTETVLANPEPGKKVATMDVISTHSRASYVLLAATVADRDPQRPVTPPVPFRPAENFDGTLTVHVVDKDTGEPIAGAEVYPGVDVDDTGVVGDPVLTGENGEAVMHYPVARTASYFVQVNKTNYTGRMGNWQRGNIPQTVTYRLTRGLLTIGGVVVDGAGQPLAGAQVRLDAYQFNGEDGAYLPNPIAHTGADGHWSLAGLPAGYRDFGLTVTHANFPQAQFYADGSRVSGMSGQHLPLAQLQQGKAVLKLSAGNRVDGTVRDAAGQPVAGAKIFVGFDRYMSGAIKKTADANGNFTLSTLGLGDNYLTVSAPGFAPEFRTVAVAESNPPVNIVLQPGRVIHGRVVDKAGQPIADAQVSFDGLADRSGIFSGRTMEWEKATDAEGRFTWDSAPAKAVNLTIQKGDHMTLEWVRVETDSTNENTFTMGSPLTVSGKVTDADTGKPIDAFKVTPGWPQQGESARWEKQRAEAAVDGHYRVRYDSPIIISSPPFDFVFQVSAPGYAPAVSRAIKPDEGEVTWDVTLKKTPGMVATVQTAAGQPAAGMKVYLATGREYLQLDGTEVSSQNQETESYETDAGGHFELPPQTGDYYLVTAGPAGFGLVTQADFTNSRTLTVQPWGRVEGTLLNRGRPMAGKELYYFIGDGSEQRNLWMKTPVAVDEAGHFSFPTVPAGALRIELKQPLGARSWSYLELQTVDVKPGETQTVSLTLTGRAVTGRWVRGAGLSEAVNLEQGNISLRPQAEPPPLPKGMTDQEKIQQWYRDWVKSAEGKKYMAVQRRAVQLEMKADGTLHGEGLTPGKYTLAGNFWGNGSAEAEIESRAITVPEESAGTGEPFDLGEVVVKAVKHMNAGEAAPDFSVKTLDGQPLKLSDYRGKYVLLDFWATWCGPCVAETPNMKATYDAYGSNPKFVMISLSLDQQTELPQKFARTHDIKWVQGFLGDWSKDTVTKDYSVRGIPSIFLIGPDGKIVAQNLRGEGIKAAVAGVLN